MTCVLYLGLTSESHLVLMELLMSWAYFPGDGQHLELVGKLLLQQQQNQSSYPGARTNTTAHPSHPHLHFPQGQHLLSTYHEHPGEETLVPNCQQKCFLLHVPRGSENFFQSMSNQQL